MPTIVVYDTNVIYPASLRDLLIRLARTDIVDARWTNLILQEMVDSISRKQPDLKVKLERTCSLMNSTVSGALVTDYEYMIPNLNLPDTKDRHVLAAAIHCGAQNIITNNLKDFPQNVLDLYNIKALSPDDFIIALCQEYLSRVGQIVVEQANDLRLPPSTVDDLLDHLDRVGIPKSSKIIRYHLECTNPGLLA